MASPKPLKVLAAGLPDDECTLVQAWLEAEGMVFARIGPEVGLCLGREADVVLVDGALILQDPRWFNEAGRASFGSALVPVVARGGVIETVQALRNGATDCVVRPLRVDKLLLVVEKAAGMRTLQAQVDRLRGETGGEGGLVPIVGESPAMREALQQTALAAAQPVDVLILGETGTGKELFARAVHGLSLRHQGPFVAVDCGALPGELFESLLFGHRRGAFTGASEDKVGLLEQAQGGTLFLDEVGNLPLDAQAKLLRALQTRENWRLGDLQPTVLDLRVIAATNSDLEREAKAGRFRLDLLHRLQDISLRLPPLRDRDGDVLLLAQLFMNRNRTRFHLPPVRLDQQLLVRLLDYPWPGNVRQLENAMKHAAVLAGESVRLEDLPEDLRTWQPAPGAPSAAGEPSFKPQLPEGLMPLWQAEKLVVGQMEAHLIAEALAACAGDRNRAAEALGLHPKTLQKKMKEYAL